MHSALSLTAHLTGTDKAPRIDSREIAKRIGIQHDSAIQTLTKYREAFERLGHIAERDVRPPLPGRPECFALLNEDHAHLLLIMSRNTPRTVALKVAYLKKHRAASRAGHAPSGGAADVFGIFQAPSPTATEGAQP